MRKAFSSFLVLFVLVAAASAIAATAFAASTPESEPNGESVTANSLDTRGRCYAYDTAAISPAGDVDVFSIPASAGQQGWVSTDTGGTQATGATSRDTKLQLLAPNTSLIEEDDDDGTGNGGDGTIETGLASIIGGRVLPVDGTYFAEVLAFSPTAIINPYRIFAATTANILSPEQEPNGTQATANAVVNCQTPIGGQISPAGDQDVYSVPLSKGQGLFVDADADPERDGGTDLVLELLSPSGAVLASIDSSITSTGAAEGFDYDATPESGTYGIRVRDFNAGSTGTYHILIAADDITPPTTTGLGGPAGASRNKTQSISFSGADNVSSGASLRFQCSLTAASAASSFGACGSSSGDSRSISGDGVYRYAVRAVDATGNADQSPAEYTFRLDRTAPKLKKVRVKVKQDSAKLRFKASDATALKFECKLDAKAFKNCTKAKKRKFSGLTSGKHKIKLRAVDAAGNTKVVVKKFRVG